MPDPTVSTGAPRMWVGWPRPAGVGAACAAIAGLTVALVGVAAAAAHVLVPHALQPVAHKALAAQPLSGLATLVFALGAPLHWHVGATGPAQLSGTLRAGALAGPHPLVLAGPVLVAIAVFLAGFLAARHAVRTGRSATRAAAGTAACFAVLSSVAAMAVNRGSVTFAADLTARVHVDVVAVLLLSAAWAAVGATAGWALALHRLPSVTDAIASWRVRVVGPASGLLVSGALVVALVSPGVGTAGTAAATPTTTADAPSTTVTSTAPATSTTAAPAVAAAQTTSTARAGGRSSGARATTSTTGRTAATTSTAPAATATSHSSGLSFDPPAPGTYSYTTSGSASWGLGKTVFPSTSTLVVDPAVGNRQHSRRSVLTVAGEGFVLDQWLEYWPSGIRVSTQRITTTFNKSTAVRDLRASTTQLYLSPTPSPGEHHEFDLASPLVAAHEVVDVLRTETITIAGQPVNAAVVRTVLHLSGDASGTLQFDQWFDMSRRIVVKETNTATVKASVVTLNSNYNATLQRLTPS